MRYATQHPLSIMARVHCNHLVLCCLLLCQVCALHSQYARSSWLCMGSATDNTKADLHLASLPGLLAYPCFVTEAPVIACLPEHLWIVQISLGPFSDLPAFEVQTIAQVHDGVSILGQASQVIACSIVQHAFARSAMQQDTIVTDACHLT